MFKALQRTVGKARAVRMDLVGFDHLAWCDADRDPAASCALGGRCTFAHVLPHCQLAVAQVAQQVGCAFPNPW